MFFDFNMKLVHIANNVFKISNINVMVEERNHDMFSAPPIKYLPDKIVRKLINIHVHNKIFDSP